MGWGQFTSISKIDFLSWLTRRQTLWQSSFLFFFRDIFCSSSANNKRSRPHHHPHYRRHDLHKLSFRQLLHVERWIFLPQPVWLLPRIKIGREKKQIAPRHKWIQIPSGKESESAFGQGIRGRPAVRSFIVFWRFKIETSVTEFWIYTHGLQSQFGGTAKHLVSAVILSQEIWVE